MPESVKPEESCQMSVLDHLEELRFRIIKSLIALSACFVVGFIYSRDVIDILKAPVLGITDFVQIAPGEVFLTSIRVATYVAFYLASPVILYQLICFVSPGLKSREKKYLIPILVFSFLLFTLGIIFSYYLAIPLALNFLLGYGSEVARNTISISKYISFNAALIFSMGIVFQVPLMLLFLALINVVSSKKLLEWWKYVIVIAFVVGAIVTPSPDPFAQSIVAGAILILYSVSIALIKAIKK